MDSCFKEEAIGAVGGVGLSSLTASSSQPQYLVCFKKQISVRCAEKKEKKMQLLLSLRNNVSQKVYYHYIKISQLDKIKIIKRNDSL